MSEGVGGGTPGDLPALVEDLVAKLEAVRADVDEPEVGPVCVGDHRHAGPSQRADPSDECDPVDLAVLAEWVESLQVRYAAAVDWLRPCWWRHGFVVEELAALRVAWLAVYDASKPVDPTAGVKWHEEAEKCRERIRRTISVGPGCTAVSHKPDQPVTEDSRWVEELAALRNQSAGELEAEALPARPPL